jgi:hypothetical protein
MVQGHEVMHVCGSFMGVHEERGARIGTEDHVATHGSAKQALWLQKYEGALSEDGWKMRTIITHSLATAAAAAAVDGCYCALCSALLSSTR